MAEQSQGPHNDSDKDSGAHKLKGSLTQWLMLLSHKANLEDATEKIKSFGDDDDEDDGDLFPDAPEK